MTLTATPTQLINSVYDAFKTGDIPHILSVIEPNAVWRQSKMLPWGGDYRGSQGAAEFFQKLDAAMETISLDVVENIEHGDEVFSFGTHAGRSRKTGRTGIAEWMFRWRVQGGKITSYESYTDSAALLEALK